MTLSSATLDTQIIRDELRTVRQVLAPTCLADIIVTGSAEYRINFYNRHDIQEQPGEDGLYLPQPGITNALRSVIVRNPDPAANANHLQIIQQTGQHQDISDFTYQSEAEQWTLSKGNGLVRQAVENMWSDDRKTMLETKYTLDAANNRLDKQTTRFQLINGAYLITQKISDPDGHAHTTTYTRYTATTDGKKLGKIKTEQNSDGSWTRYEYDANGYLTAEITPWLDSPFSTAANPALNQATYTSYAPVDTNDAPAYNDQRPRTVTHQILGQTVRKTYHAYITGAHNQLTEITEHAHTPDAPYGNTANLRTIRTYHGTNTTHAMNGRLATVQHPDGRLETHTYEYGNLATPQVSGFSLQPSDPFTPDPDGLAWRETVTHATTTSPDGIPGKTTRQSRILDAYARDILNETHVKTATGFDRIAWTLNEYNDFTRLTATTKSDGTRETQTWGQNCCGAESRKTADGIETVFAYDPAGRRISETRLGYNGSPSLTQEYALDATGRRLTTTLKGGDLTLVTASNTYSNAGHLLTSTDAQGITTTYEQGCCGLESTTIRAGLTNLTVRYPDGRTHYTQQNGTRQQTYTYGINSDGTQWTCVYTGSEGTNSPAWQRTTTDLLGRTIRTERPGFDQSGTGVPPVIATENTYNTQGQLTKIQLSGFSPQPSPTLFEYDLLGAATLTAQDINTNGIIDLAGPDRVSSNATEFVQISGDWYRESRSYTYPEDGSATALLTSTQRQRLTGLGTPLVVPPSGGSPLLASETISTDLLGNTSTNCTVIDRDNRTVVQVSTAPDSVNDQYQITINGLATESVSKTGIVTTFGHDALGRRIATTDPRTGTSITHYNAKGQVEWVEDAATNRTTFAYAPATGQRIATTDALSNTTHNAYNIEGQLIATWGATYPVAYEYDAYGRMSAMYTYRGTNEINSADDLFTLPTDRTTWSYDEATGLLTNKLYADTNGVSYTYTSDGKLASRTWARGITTTYSYTNSGEMVGIDYSDSTPDIAFSHDRIGRQVTVADAQGTHTFGYDPLTLALTNEVVVADGVTNVITRNQDSLGRSSGLTLSVAGGSDSEYSVAYGYSEIGRFESVDSVVRGVTNNWQYSYLSDSDMISQLAESNAGITATRTYEPNRNLITTIENRTGDTSVALSRFDYTNDPLGRRTKRIDNASITNDFGYNIRSEVIEALMGTNTYGYAYDPIGNRLSEVRELMSEVSTNLYTANALNQYSVISNFSSQVSSLSPSYDSDGNMLTHGEWTFTWNGENRLITASNTTTVIENAYDYMGRRITKTTKNQAQGTTNQTQFVYDGWAMIREQSTTTTNSYVYGLDLSGSMQGAGTIGGILTADLNGTTAYYFYDANGNVTDLVDANGNIVAHYEYDAFGNTTAVTGDMANANPFRFSTKYLDTETSLYYYGYRHLSTELGRWVSRDPLLSLVPKNEVRQFFRTGDIDRQEETEVRRSNRIILPEFCTTD